jgi:hypothetical protein
MSVKESHELNGNLDLRARSSNEDVQMYLSSAIKSLTCVASLGLLSLLVTDWVPKPVVLILFGSGVLLMAFGWVITLFIFINEIMDQEVVTLERQ